MKVGLNDLFFSIIYAHFRKHHILQHCISNNMSSSKFLS